MKFSGLFRYPGGKSEAVYMLYRFLPDNIKTVISPFIGAGSFEIFLALKGIKVIGYDILLPLVYAWQAVRENMEYVGDILLSLPRDKNTFYETRDVIMEVQNSKSYLSGEEKYKVGAYFIYHMTMCHGPVVFGNPSEIKLNTVNFKGYIQRITRYKTAFLNIEVHFGDFTETIPKHSHDFLFMDPPYYTAKGLYVGHNAFDHEKLSHFVKQHQGLFLITYDNCPEVRQLYQDFYIRDDIEWQYYMNGGVKQLKKKSRELLIANYNIENICLPNNQLFSF